MHEIHVSTVIAAPVREVFDLVTDHASFLTYGETTCSLVVEGTTERNGLGAVREVKSGGMTFREEIVGFDAPTRYDYVITSSKGKGGKAAPLKHERGWLTFTPTGSSTRIDWHTRYRVTLPIIGWFVERFVLSPRLTKQFQIFLAQAKSRAEEAYAPQRTK